MSLTQKIGNFGLKLLYPFFYFGQWNKKTIIYEVDSSKFKVRTGTSDKIIIWEVWNKKEYTDDEFEINPLDIVVDIGAHIGIFTVYAAKNANRGKVYAYEPYLENYNLLMENIKLNNLINVNVFNVAVLDQKGQFDFYIGEENIGGSSFYKNVWSKEKIKVPTITLNDIFIQNKLKKIDFLKLDVEGAEYKILLNGSSKLLKKVNKIAIEFHDIFTNIYTHKYLKFYLEENGFDVNISTTFILGKVFKYGIIKAKRHI